jgi:inosine triphosphate pyrophosphatase
VPELQGEPEAVAVEKCRLASAALNAACIVEDTSLCYNALKGLPGVYIKWFLDKTGLDGLNNLLAAYPDKSAYAQCVFAFAQSKAHAPIPFVGRCNGTIVPARGPKDFGWDPVFQPDGFDKTYRIAAHSSAHCTASADPRPVRCSLWCWCTALHCTALLVWCQIR